MLLNRHPHRLPSAIAAAAATAFRPRTRPTALALAFILAAAVLLAGMLAGPTPPASADTITVSTIAITSSPAAGDDYHAGETITVRVTFSSTVTAYGDPVNATLAIGIDGGATVEAAAPDATGRTTSTVDFNYVVKSTDSAASGITVATTAMGGTFTHEHTGTPHNLATVTLPNTLTTAQTGHKINSTDTIDYDTDDDGLIEVDSLAKLDAIRYNLNGDGNPTGANAASHSAAFPTPMDYHGCDADGDGTLAACTGYELTANLNFDENNDGQITAADPAYWNSGAGWNPIGGHADPTATAAADNDFIATLEGNNHTISNLYISLDSNSDNDGAYVGLFADLGAASGAAGAVQNVSLINPVVSNTRGGNTAGLPGTIRTGALAGRINVTGTARGVSIAGGSVTATRNSASITTALNLAGGLAGFNAGTVSDSDAGCALTATGTHGRNDIGGGLVGRNNATVTNSYASGTVQSDDTAGGLVGSNFTSGQITGSHATGNITASGIGAEAGGLAGQSDNSITASYATGSITASAADSAAGGLVGLLDTANGAVRASYATGAVTASGGNVNAGGLVGRAAAGADILASYAAGAVTASGSGAANNAGGLVGELTGTGATIAASYARGAVAATAGTANNAGGLVGNLASSATVSESHWDSTTTGQTAGAGAGAVAASTTAKTTSNLQTPDTYGATSSDTFYNWNVDADADSSTGVSGNDDPWHFGANNQYPILKFGHNALSIAQQRAPQRTLVDYDNDNDNLIDITTLLRLNAIRYDLDGNGHNTGDAAVNYFAAFPGITPGMGCPAACIGYELLNDLDFDYDEDGSTHTAGTIDGGDTVAATAAYFDSAAGWTPLGGHTSTASPFTAIFEGNGNTIDNLYINLSTSAATDGRHVGLFARIGTAAGGAAGIVRNVGLVDPYVANTRTGATAGIYAVTGALAGRGNDTAAISGSYVSGGSVTATQNTSTVAVINNAGCLLGYNLGAVNDSYASCTVQATGNATGNTVDHAGGLAGQSEGAVTRSYATGTAMADDQGGGLFGAMAGGGTVTASYATGAVTVSAAEGRAGGLVGHLTGANTTVVASFATGDATASGGNADAGGLVGRASNAATVAASYATGAATVTGTGAENNAGGLVGELTGASTNVNASYAIGAVSASGGTANRNGGVAGSAVSSATVTNSYWNNESTADGGTGRSASAGSAATFGRTGAQLRTPTDYGTATTDAFYNWNVNLDGVTGNDDPWDFGTSSDYPVISYAGISLAAQGRTPSDYDADNDGLIDIDTLAKLNAVRHDLDGNGNHDGGTGDTAYNAAFVNRDRSAAGLMGCPLGDHDADTATPQQAHCTGYELTADLDFDTDGDGSTYTVSGGTVTVDADDTGNFFDASEGWAPIGNNTTGYSGVFEGNRHVIDHLFINVPSGSTNDVVRERVGLFAKLDRGGVIRGLGLTDVYVNRERTGSGIVFAGALVGQSFGTVTASSATGEVRATDVNTSSSSQVGGLVGESGNRSAVNASWADVTVTVDGPMVRAGGLVGTNLGGTIAASHAFGAVNVDDSPNGRVGGLVGSLNLLSATTATVTASYARGTVDGTGTSTTGRVLGGLVGGGSSASGVTDSYWDNSSSGTNQANSYGGGEGKTTAELQTPTGYTGIYANWNVNVDGVTGNDDPWHFGAASQYPTLKYGGFSPAAQGSAGADYDTDSDGLIEITTPAQLDAIRYDLDGNGRPTSVLPYRAAFPAGDVGSDAEMGTAGRMGCAYDDDNDPATNPALTCRGYELMGDLDFDTDGDGSTHTAGVGDPDDDYYNAGAGWAPIGGHDADAQPYTAILDGNGNDIANLYLNLDTGAANAGTYVGLFADLTGTVRNVGLTQPYVKNARRGTAAFVRTGALAGRNSVGGIVRNSSVTGGSVTGDQSAVAGTPNNFVGCLLGYNAGTVRDSSASCAATATGTDDTRDQAGGLVGENAAITVNSVTGAGLIANSHATGNVTSDRNAGGLVGVSTTGGRVTGSYAEGDVTSTGANGRAGGLLSLISAGTVVSDSYAIGAVRVSGSNSIAGGLVGKAQNADTTVTRSYATGAVTASGAGVRNLPDQLGNLLGGLAGELTTGAQITASYATGDVSTTTTAANSILGGLVGHMAEVDTLVRAAYATGSATANGGGTNNVGGLLGELDDILNNIDSSYAIGAVSATGSGAGVVNSVGGLVGALISPALATQVANSYYDNTAAGTGQTTSPGGGSGQTTTALQTPVGYTGIYANWNQDLDNADTDNDLTTGADDPWHFGSSAQYPILQYNRDPAGIARQLGIVIEPGDYDRDNDGLIDVATLAHLNAIRWDLNGDGRDLIGAAAAGYLAAYPGYTPGMGCAPGDHDGDTATPNRPHCTGYELTASLDFDTNGSGATHTNGAGDSGDDYYNDGAGWQRIGDFGGGYNATFDGRGYTIDNLFMRNPSGERYGLFGQLDGSGEIIALGVRNAYITYPSGMEPLNVGILAGVSDGDIVASYTTGTVRGYDAVGGLVGYLGTVAGGGASITASYSTAAVVSADKAGGLVGQTRDAAINDSYFAGPGVSGASGNVGGLLGERVSGGTATVSADSYWRNTSGVPTVSDRSQATAGKTAAALTGPAGYTDIYTAWNIDLDNADNDNDPTTGGDDPWNFGAADQFPVLHYGGHTLTAQGRDTPTDYDSDDDGLIDIKTLAQLDAIRHDLDGNGYAIAAAYNNAFPNRNTPAAGRMGCPNGACNGYELLNNLDFDTNADGAVTATEGEVTGDEIPNWTPIGTAANPYQTRFDGKGHIIANLTINSTDLPAVGLFGVAVGDSGAVPTIENVGLAGVNITAAINTAGNLDVGALVGYLRGTVRASYAAGAVRANAGANVSTTSAGGLVGIAGAATAGPSSRLDANYAAVNVAVTSESTLVGANNADAAGGLVGRIIGGADASTALTSSYARAMTVTSARAGSNVGGLIGRVQGSNVTAEASYWDTTAASELATSAGGEGVEGKTTQQLEAPTRYSGIYQTWNEQDLDGDDSPDAPWDFGDRCQYPVLEWAGHDPADQRAGDDTCPVEGETEYVAPPIVYNLNIRFSVRSLTLDEGETGRYRVRMSEAPVGRPARVRIESNNSDVVVSPTALTFSSDDWNEWQTVSVTVARDANDSDENAFLAHRGPNNSYGGIIVTVNDTWPGAATQTVNGHTVTLRYTADASPAVTVTAPPTLDRDTDITISAAPADTPQLAPGYNLGESAAARMAAGITVDGTPAAGLTICLPVPAALITEAGGNPLTLLRYAAAGESWTAVAGSQRRAGAAGSALLCAAGVTEYGVFAVAYALPGLGPVSNLTAAPGTASGSATLTWTPGANATAHWIAGIKQSDPYQLAVWSIADAIGTHTATGLESGASYIFTVTAGRGEAAATQWSPWAPWVFATPN